MAHSSLLAIITRHVDTYLKMRTTRWRRGTIVGQGSTPTTVRVRFTGQAADAGMDIPVARAFTNTTVGGGSGAPVVGADVYVCETVANNPMLAFQLLTGPSDVPNGLCPLILTCDPPTDVSIPSAPLAIGPWASTQPLSGHDFSYDNPGAAMFIALDSAKKADVLHVYARINGSISDFPPLVILADHTLHDTNNNPRINVEANGYGWFKAGVITTVTNGVNPDNTLPYGSIDGAIAVRQDFGNARLWFRGGGWRFVPSGYIFSVPDPNTIPTAQGVWPSVLDIGYGGDGSVWTCTGASQVGRWKRLYPTTLAALHYIKVEATSPNGGWVYSAAGDVLRFDRIVGSSNGVVWDSFRGEQLFYISATGRYLVTVNFDIIPDTLGAGQWTKVNVNVQMASDPPGANWVQTGIELHAWNYDANGTGGYDTNKADFAASLAGEVDLQNGSALQIGASLTNSSVSNFTIDHAHVTIRQLS